MIHAPSPQIRPQALALGLTLLLGCGHPGGEPAAEAGGMAGQGEPGGGAESAAEQRASAEIAGCAPRACASLPAMRRDGTLVVLPGGGEPAEPLAFAWGAQGLLPAPLSEASELRILECQPIEADSSLGVGGGRALQAYRPAPEGALHVELRAPGGQLLGEGRCETGRASVCLGEGVRALLLRCDREGGARAPDDYAVIGL